MDFVQDVTPELASSRFGVASASNASAGASAGTSERIEAFFAPTRDVGDATIDVDAARVRRTREINFEQLVTIA